MTGHSSDSRQPRPPARTCAECGTQPSPGQSFCDGCGAVLGWAPSAAPEVPAPREEPADTPAAAPAHGGTAAPQGGTAPAPGHGSPAFGERSTPVPGAPGYGAPAGTGADTAAPGGGSAAGTVPAPGYGAPGEDPDATPPQGTYLGPGAAPQGPFEAAPEPPSPPTADTEPLPGTPVPPAGAPPYPAAPGTPPAPGAPPAAAHPQGPDAAARARALLVPVDDPQNRPPAPPSVAPVMPGRPAAARPTVRTPGLEPDDGGPAACPWCGTGNREDRHFCRRCAMPMAGRQADDPARLPWWRRLLDRRGRPAPWAGDRPRLRRGLGRVLTWVAGAAAVALVVVAGTHVGSGVQAVEDHFAKRAPLAPDSVRAWHSFKGHGPQLAFDKYNNTWWGPGISESADGQWLEADFQQPTNLLNLVLTPGVSTEPGDLAKEADPHRIEVVITTADGKKSTRYLTMDQGSGGQTRSFRVRNVRAVRFILRTAYGAAADKQVAIAEIEFFGRSSSSS